jgi:quinol monooxygenase YgiN
MRAGDDVAPNLYLIAREDPVGRIVIACYKPKPGMEERLIELTRSHVRRLRAEGLVTDREPIAMVAQDGTVVEVFEWRSAEAMEAAHSNPNVQKMWQEYAGLCEYVPVADLAEANQLFSEFSPYSP